MPASLKFQQWSMFHIDVEAGFFHIDVVPYLQLEDEVFNK